MRSAASETFSHFLEKSLQLPELTLPHLPPAPAEIDLRSLSLGSADLMLRSAREFGAFRIRYHGISSGELLTMADEAERVFEKSRNVVVELNGPDGEMIPCVRSSKGSMEFTAHDIIRDQAHRNFWYSLTLFVFFCFLVCSYGWFSIISFRFVSFRIVMFGL